MDRFLLKRALAKGARNVAAAIIAYIPIAAVADYGVGLSGSVLTIDIEKVVAAVGVFVGTVVWDWVKRTVIRR